MNSRRGVLIVFSGPSGVGKDSVLGALMPRRKDVCLSVSSTTRLPRPGEVDGVDYNFISRDEFESKIADNAMLEFAEYAGNYYGTPKKWVEDKLNAGFHVILEIELVGTLKIREIIPGAVLIFLMPPSLKTLRDRLVGRGTETQEAIDKRMDRAKKEILQAGAYDYIIVNNTLAECCEQLDAVITAASLRAAHLKNIIGEVIDHA